jgi:tripartite ATP-independent transporter DctP family solute receptor
MTTLRPFVLAVAAVLLVAACGPASSPGSTSQPSATTAPTSTAAASGIPTLKALAAGETAIVIRYGDCCAKGTTNAIFGDYWQELVAKYGNGRVKLEVFHDSTLGDQRALWEGIPLGTHDATFNGADLAANFEPKLGVFGMPFLFATEEEAYKVFDSPVGAELLKLLEAKGYKPFGFSTLGLRGTATTNRPLNSVADFKGFKLRIAESPVNRKTWEALGANPIPMSFNDVVPALQQGLIEGVDLPPSFIVSAKLYEQLKVFAPTNHHMVVILAAMSLPKFNSYPKEIQAFLEATAKEALKQHRQFVLDGREQALAIMKQNGMKITQLDTAPMVKAVQPVYDELGKDYSDYIKRILALRSQ